MKGEGKTAVKYYIYGLIDPRDYKVRYVGRTSQRMNRRLAHHTAAAKRGNTKPVYEWMRSLQPLQPWLVCLETCVGLVKKTNGLGWRDDAEPAEVKWIKRFRRDCLNQIAFESGKKDWQKLVNPDEAQGHE
jgi:hypothetical protein